MNNSRDGQDNNSGRLLFVLAINLSVFFVSLAFICHLTALIALFRPELRRRLFTPFMINLCVISMVLAGCSYFLPLGLDKLRQDVNENAQKEMFVCNWTAFMGILCKSAYSSTVCAMSVVSKIALKRCTCGETQVISRKRKLILFSALWAYPLVLSGIPSFLKDPFGRSASGLMCQLRWPSKENAHNIYNIFSSIALFLPMAICFKAQYDFARILRRALCTQQEWVKRRLIYRKKVNRLVIGLAVYFFVSHLPYHVTNVLAMSAGRYTLSAKTAFALEVIEKSNLLFPPFAYVLMNHKYRVALREMIASSTSQTQRAVNAHPRRNRAGWNERRGQPNNRVKFHNKVEPTPKEKTPSSTGSHNRGKSKTSTQRETLTPTTK